MSQHPVRDTEGAQENADQAASMSQASAEAGEPRRLPGDGLLTVAQAGEYLGTGERFIRRLITERRISFVKIGKYVRLERSALEALVDAGRVHSQR